MNYLPMSARVRVLSSLVEGCSLRSIERDKGVHRDTVMRLGVAVGEGCARLHDHLVRNLAPTSLELDEVWAYVGKKQGHVRDGDNDEVGDQYTFTALDKDTKLFAAYRTGRRNGTTATAFACDLRARVLGKPQLTTDGFKPYIQAIETAFGARVHYAQLVKHFEGEDDVREASRRYSPGKMVSTEKRILMGSPDSTRICTSHVERSNLTLRMSQRRWTRLTNAFSKRLPNLCAAASLFVTHYNFARIHSTLRTTPAMAAGIEGHVWDLEELLDRALAAKPYQGPDPASVANGPSGRVVRTTRGTFRVLDGGRS